MSASLDIRWKQRLQNFDRAVGLLREPFDSGFDRLNTLEKEGVVQRFEVCVELAWKTLKDYMEHGGLVSTPGTPRQVIKEAYAARILGDGQTWLDMLDHRNLVSHTYDAATFEALLESIANRYLPTILSLHQWLLEKSKQS